MAAAAKAVPGTSQSSWTETAGGKRPRLPRIKGHEEGSRAARECVEACAELKIDFLTLYAFSAENWQRPKSEVFALMRLLEKFLKEKTPELIEKNVRLQAIGRLTDCPTRVRSSCTSRSRRRPEHRRHPGSRAELRRPTRDHRRNQKSASRDRARSHRQGMIDVEMFSKHLYTRYYPDPDLLIRTSGEMRLSNFLLWQTSYTEMYVTPKLWPISRKRFVCSGGGLRTAPTPLRARE